MNRELLSAAAEGMERLKWLVLEHFSVLPGDKAARSMTDADFVWCGLQMLLDAAAPEEKRAGEAGGNPGFDRKKFEKLGGGV